jgi:hypothetical protein
MYKLADVTADQLTSEEEVVTIEALTLLGGSHSTFVPIVLNEIVGVKAPAPDAHTACT